ncbi:hypothetical protein K493DRAFT_321531 [Basidiobolus meristosporus CBS 931.73]|uniref:TOG domain-containing protein n=1 Tax=Basidiobolus meristosporus CBS 931.73 TaxID=1314790 RepID=A0A1Y1WSV0_9FUNG|nr:hypothetical protein K493DRAFT_321531 [Basidiobolus meristosporus CBS 931.73]|eukprot:ORX76619.1 hypothetical protein K493DRAFT_321531 [Basidiobolus meristosporus CBS 931.73]
MGLTEKSYEAEVDGYNQVFLGSTEEQWDKRRDAINNLRSSLKEAVTLRNFIPVCFIVSTQIIECIKSERTQLCNLAMDYVEEIAKHAKSEFDPLAEYYLASILRNCGRTNKIVRLKAGNCLASIMSNAGPTSWFVKMLNEKSHENKDIRVHVAKALSAVLKDGHDIAHFVVPIEEAISVSIADASPEVREFGMQSYREFFQRFPDREQSFRGKLDISTLKTLEKLQARQASAANKKSQRPGIAELKRQMKAKMMASAPASDVIIVADQPESAPIEPVAQEQPQQDPENKPEPEVANVADVSTAPVERSEPRPPSPPKVAPLCNKVPTNGPRRAPVQVKRAVKPQPPTARPLEVKTNTALLSKQTPSLRRTNLTMTGGAQRVLKPVEPLKKKQLIGDLKKGSIPAKAPLQSQNRTVRNPMVKPAITQPTAKVNSGMPTPNSKRTLNINKTELPKRSLSSLSEPINNDNTKLPKPTRFNASNFSRPTASSNARLVATTSETLKRKETIARGLSVNGKPRKTIGTTGPLRVLRSN